MGQRKGYKMSEEHKENLRQSNKKTYENQSLRLVISNSKKGKKRKPFSEEWRNKLASYGSDNGNYKYDIYRHEGGSDPGYWSLRLEKICYLCKSKVIVECHHKDGIRKHNKRENVCMVCLTCHYFWHQN